MIGFGVGYLTLVPPAGSADITPIRVAKLQEVSLDLSYSTKELKSNKIFADDVARASAKISGKAKSADVKARALASLLTGATSSAGQLVPQMDQGTGVIASAQYDTGVTSRTSTRTSASTTRPASR
jgi:hypothetical protein